MICTRYLTTLTAIDRRFISFNRCCLIFVLGIFYIRSIRYTENLVRSLQLLLSCFMLSSDCPLGILCPCIIEKIKEMYAICHPRVILTGEKKESLGNWYHPLCLKCRKCGRQLAVGNHAEVSFLIALLIRINV